MALRPALLLVFHELLKQSEEKRTLTLDVVSASLGVVSASADEIDTLFLALEAEGRTILDAHEPRSPARDLAAVLAGIRTLSAVTGKKPSLAELSSHTGLSVDTVSAALRFAAVMAR